jgi:hypothetical protein
VTYGIINSVQKEHQKVLRLLKTLYGMADEMDTTDFFLQNKENTNIVFVKDDEMGNQA